MIDLTLMLAIFTPFIGYVAEQLTNYSASLLLTMSIGLFGIITLFANKQDKAYHTIILFFFLSYVAMSLINALTLDDVSIFSYKDMYRHRSLIPVFLFLVIGGHDIKSTTYNNAIRALKAVFWISILVMLIQEYYDPTFFTSRNWYINLRTGRDFSRVQDRLPSIYSFAGSQSSGVGFNTIYGILLSDSTKNNISKKSYIYIGAAFVFSFLQRSRWVIIFYIIVSLQLLFKVKVFNIIRLKHLIVASAVFASIFFVFSKLQVPIADIFHDRYLDERKGGVAEGSWRARSNSYETVAKYIDDGLFFGIQDRSLRSEVFTEIGRSSDALLIGIVDPLFNYGIVGSFFYYLSLILIFMMLLRFSISSRNYNYLMIYAAFIVTNMSISYLNFNDMGMIIMFIMFNHEYRRMSYKEEPNDT